MFKILNYKYIDQFTEDVIEKINYPYDFDIFKKMAIYNESKFEHNYFDY